ncbi:hypothetical protein HYW55_04275 [Candidatus Gottesmanbacteria bacterium]|nr:hypothetical protein [Candidatus Gottesmanbacteria bacterium]
MKKKKKKINRRLTIVLLMLVTLLTGIGVALKVRGETIVSSLPKYDCGKNTNCVLIQGNDTIIKRVDQSNLFYPLKKGWFVTKGSRGGAPAYFEIWHPPSLEVENVDSGGIEIRKGDESVLIIWDIFLKKNFTAPETNQIVKNLVQSELMPTEKSQKLDREKDVFMSELSFTDGKKYFLIKYPHYFRWVYGIQKETIEKNGYSPIFSSYNDLDYYIGDTNTGYIVVVYDYKLIPKEDVLTILQNMKLL